MFVFNVQNQDDGTPRLNLHLTQRSNDIALGIPYNIAGYSLLIALFSHFTGIRPGIFAQTLVDAHIYTAKPDGSMAEFDHVPGLREQLSRSPRQLPRLSISPELRSLDDIEALLNEDTDTVMSRFELDGYDPHPAIPFKVAV
jgi:thymidylate synthase